MKRKKLPPPPLGLVSLPGLNPEEVRLYESAKFDEIGLRCIDYGSYCLMHPESKEAFERLWLYLDVPEILIWLEEQVREAIRKGQQQGRPNNFSAAAYPIGVDETDKLVVVSLRLSIYTDGTAGDLVAPGLQDCRVPFRCEKFPRHLIESRYEPFPGRLQRVKCRHSVTSDPSHFRVLRLPVTD
jgi:hypothetical protein